MSTIRAEAATLDIMNLKLVSGEEIVGLIHRNKPDESIMILEEPLQVVQHSSSDGQSYTVSFQEYAPMVENSLVAVIRSNVVAYGKCNLDTKERYLSMLINMAQEQMPPDPIEEELDQLDDNESIIVH